MEKLDRELQRQDEIVRRQFLYQRVEYVRIKFGDAEADTYLECKASPPAEKKRQDKCARLETKVQQALAAQPK